MFCLGYRSVVNRMKDWFIPSLALALEKTIFTKGADICEAWASGRPVQSRGSSSSTAQAVGGYRYQLEGPSTPRRGDASRRGAARRNGRRGIGIGGSAPGEQRRSHEEHLVLRDGPLDVSSRRSTSPPSCRTDPTSPALEGRGGSEGRPEESRRRGA